MFRHRKRRHPAAFTLVELLTVIAVVGVLAGILVAVTGKIRRDAGQTRSLANLRQIGSALLLYCGDHKNKVPVWHDYTQSQPDQPDLPDLAGRYWWELLQTYTGPHPEVFHSPAHDQFDSSSRSMMRATISYGWNYAVMGRHIGDNSKQGDHFLRITDFVNPSRTLAASDGRDIDSWGYIASDAPPEANRYAGKVPSLFADGHVAILPRSDFDQVEPWFSVTLALPANR